MIKRFISKLKQNDPSSSGDFFSNLMRWLDVKSRFLDLLRLGLVAKSVLLFIIFFGTNNIMSFFFLKFISIAFLAATLVVIICLP